MTDTAIEKNGRGNSAARRDRPGAAARRLPELEAEVAELETENTALRRALARAGLVAERVGSLHAGELAGERVGRAADAAEARSAAAEAEARHGRETAAGRADLAVAEEDRDALRRANAELATSRAALREREERLRLVLDSAADYAILTTGLDRRVATWNAGAEWLLGWSAEEIVGRSADLIFTPEDRAAGAPEREAAGALAEGRVKDERWHQRRDGSRFWASGLVMPLRDPGADPGTPPLGLLKIMRDRTAEREAEEALRRFAYVVEQSSDFIGIADPEGRAVFVNEAGRRMVGLADMEAARRTRVLDFFAPEDRPFVEAVILPTMRREGRWVGDFRFRHFGTGRTIPVRYNQFEIRDERGRAIGVATVSPDITERKRAEGRRAALVELADRLRDLRDPGEIAHTAAEVTGRALGAARAGYAPVTPDGHYVIERDWTDGRVPSATGRFRVSDYGAAYAAKLAEGGAVAIADLAEDPLTAAVAANYAAHGARSQLSVPLVAHGRLAALIYLHDAEPRAWTEAEVAFVRGAAERAWAAAERARAEGRRTLLLNELNHRVKNTLAVVQSLALQTARGAPDLPAFSAAFQARLIALARAHDLLTREDWTGAPLAGVVRAALAPLALDAARVDLSGCASGTVLPPGAALALTMALHELATNALKHGALSVPGGRVSIACRAAADHDDGAAPVVEWVERGGPPVAGPPAKRGFGLRLLERGLAAQAGMGAAIRFEPEGVRCTLGLPPLPIGPPAKGA